MLERFLLYLNCRGFCAIFGVAIVAIFCSQSPIAHADPQSAVTYQYLPYLLINNTTHEPSTCVSQCAVAAVSQVFPLPSSGFLHNFKIDSLNWLKSPPLDRALIAAYRFVLTSENENTKVLIAKAAGLDDDRDLSAALPIIWQAQGGKRIDASVVRALQSRLGFTALDILRLPDFGLLETARELHAEDASLFSTDEWVQLFARIEDRWQGRPLIDRFPLLTLPSGFEPRTVSLDEVREFLNMSIFSFKERFDLLKDLGEQMPAEKKAAFVEVLCEGIRNLFGGTTYVFSDRSSADPFADRNAPQLMKYLIEHESAAQLNNFLPAFSRTLMNRVPTPTSSFIVADLIRIVIPATISGIVLNTNGVSDRLIDILILNADPKNETAFDFIDMLYGVWSVQARFREQRVHDALVNQFSYLFGHWQNTFSSETWLHVDWRLRLEIYRQLMADQRAGLHTGLEFLTGKFNIDPTSNVAIRRSNEVTLIELMNYFVGKNSPENNQRAIVRLILIAQAYLSSQAQKTFAYPLFEKELTQNLELFLGQDPSAIAQLWVQLKRVVDKTEDTAAPFLSQLEPLLSRSSTSADDFDNKYTVQLALFLGKMSAEKPGVEVTNPSSTVPSTVPFDERLALSLYSQFRRRASPQALYSFAKQELIEVSRRQIKGEYVTKIIDDYTHFKGKGPLSNDPRPKLKIVSCAKIIGSR
jgi:hypothetical protein